MKDAFLGVEMKDVHGVNQMALARVTTGFEYCSKFHERNNAKRLLEIRAVNEIRRH